MGGLSLGLNSNELLAIGVDLIQKFWTESQTQLNKSTKRSLIVVLMNLHYSRPRDTRRRIVSSLHSVSYITYNSTSGASRSQPSSGRLCNLEWFSLVLFRLDQLPLRACVWVNEIRKEEKLSSFSDDRKCWCESYLPIVCTTLTHENASCEWHCFM